MNNLKIESPNITLVDLVEERLLKYFKDMKLQPGDSIPTEIELTEALGVGRSVLREALSRFRMLGLIQSRTRKGMTLSEPDMLGGLGKVIEPSIMSLNSMKEILGLRIALEIGCAHMIFTNVTEDDILELEHIIANEPNTEDNKFTVATDHAFHSKLNEIAGNELISKYQKIFYKVFVFVGENYNKYFEKYNKNRPKKDFVTHNDLLLALKKRDEDLFQKLMQKHLQLYIDFINS